MAQIAASILEFGFVAPVLVDERGEIIAGHGRLLAAKSLGLDAVPTIVRTGPAAPAAGARRAGAGGAHPDAGIVRAFRGHPASALAMGALLAEAIGIAARRAWRQVEIS